MNELGQNLLDSSNNHLFGKSRNYFYDWELKMMIEGKENAPNMKLIRVPSSFNFSACDWFREFDIWADTSGLYATNGGEYRIKTDKGKVYYLDYFNRKLKLIIEWDEEHHYVHGVLRNEDIQRQGRVQKIFPGYIFVRLREKIVLEDRKGRIFNFILKKLVKKQKKNSMNSIS